MQVISRITTQKRNKKRFNIFLEKGSEETFGFSVDEDLLVRYHLHKGMEISEAEITRILEQNDSHRAYQLALRYLGYRMRTTGEIKDYLRRKEFNDMSIATAVERLKNEKVVDDADFAKQFVSSRIRTANKGPLLIARELAQKGVANHLIDQALLEYSFDDQFIKAEEIIQKRLRRRSNHSHRRQLDQAKAALQRNGFDHDVIQEAIANFSEHKESQEEWEAIIHQGEKLFRRHTKKFSGDPYALEQRIKQGLYQRGFSLSLIDQYLKDRLEEEETDY